MFGDLSILRLVGEYVDVTDRPLQLGAGDTPLSQSLTVYMPPSETTAIATAEQFIPYIILSRGPDWFYAKGNKEEIEKKATLIQKLNQV